MPLSTRAVSARVGHVGTVEVPDLPPPGHGRTWERWRALIDVARCDLAAARLAEGHHDAVAILTELDVERPLGFLGVWAAEPQRMSARLVADGWRLRGAKSWCSGASSVDHALVTATAPDGPRLFLLDTALPGVEPIDGSWPSLGMAATDSATVELRPHGAASGRRRSAGRVHRARRLLARRRRRRRVLVRRGDRRRRAAASSGPGRPDPHRLAALGVALADLDAAGALLRASAAAIDRDPTSVAAGRRGALAVRAVVWAAGRRVLDATEDVLGARPLCLDPGFATALLDLRTYLAQHHGPADLAQLGESGLDEEVAP